MRQRAPVLYSGANVNVIFDLDGTLADCEHRIPLIRGTEKPDWDKFHEQCVLDKPIWPVIELATNLNRRGNNLEIWTGRSEVVRKQTEEWLAQHGLAYFHGTRILMRPKGDTREDVLLKGEWLDEALEFGFFKPNLVIEDRTRMIKFWRSRGITALQCAEGDF
jgi:hypothetical protein